MNHETVSLLCPDTAQEHHHEPLNPASLATPYLPCSSYTAKDVLELKKIWESV